MADNNPNNLVEELGKLPGVVQEATQAFSAFASAIESHLPDFVKGFVGLGSGVSDTSKKMEEAQKKAAAMNEEFSRIHVTGKQFADTALVIAHSLGGGTTMFKEFAAGAQGSMTTASEATEALAKDLDTLGAIPDKIIPGFSKFHQDLDKVLGKTKGWVEAGQQAEMGFYGLISAAGGLNEVFATGTDVTNKLTFATTEYTREMDQVAITNGTTMDKTIQLTKAYADVPGVITGIGTATDQAAKAMEHMTAIMKVAAGAGGDDVNVKKAVASAYANLSVAIGDTRDETERGLEMFAEMKDMQNVLALNFADSQSALEGVANQFKTIGDETAGATSIFERFGSALEKTGLTAKVSADTVSGLIKNIGEMDVATKAFMSRQAGGPGGLQGAFQIEQMLHKGDIAGVMNMAMRSAQRLMGPHIYTQDEAATSQTAQAGFFQQRSILQSGALGVGRGMDDQSASRFMEAMRSGNLQMGKEALSPRDKAAADVKSLTERGTAMQEKQYTELTRIQETLLRVSAYSAQTAFNTVRGTPAEARAQIEKDTKTAEGQFAVRYRTAGKDLTAGQYETANKKSMTEMMQDSASNVKDSMGHLLFDRFKQPKEKDQTQDMPIATEYDAHANRARIANAAMAGAHRPAMHAATTASAAAQAQQKVKLEITVNDPYNILAHIAQGEDNTSTTSTPAFGSSPSPTTTSNQSDPGY